MKTKIALGIIAALVAACASSPTWDTSVFPQQVGYGGEPAPQAVAEASK